MQFNDSRKQPENWDTHWLRTDYALRLRTETRTETQIRAEIADIDYANRDYVTNS